MMDIFRQRVCQGHAKSLVYLGIFQWLFCFTKVQYEVHAFSLSPRIPTTTRDNSRRLLGRPVTKKSTTSTCCHSHPITVALTREDGKNGKLLKALNTDQALRSMIEPVELPCIEHADGPDLARLKNCLLEESWNYVIVTSPEAARVLASVWDSSSMHSIPVAAVGKATEQILLDNEIKVVFTPSKAYATNLVEELPGSEGSKALYPASCRAPGTVANGLADRGFQVVRLNTYDTVTATWDAECKQVSQNCQIACFASPSSIRGWLSNTNHNNSVMAACIGKTSASACQELGWDESCIFFSSGSPGIEGWVEAIRDALDHLNKTASLP